MRLADAPEFQRVGPLKRLAQAMVATSATLSPEEIAVRCARENLAIERIVQTQLVAVRFESEDPELAAAVPNALSEAFIRKNLELRREAGRSTSEWLERELRAQKELLEQAENRLQTYARRHGLFFTGQAQESIAEDRMRQVQSDLLRAEAACAAAQARFEAAVSNPPETLGEVLSDDALRDKGASLTSLRQELAQTELWFKPGYAKVRELRARIGEIEADLGREYSNIVQRIENDYRAARRQADLLSLALERQSKKVSGESAAAVRYNILKREVETNRQVYDSLLQRMKDAGVAAAIQNSNITIVDPARVPVDPYEPNVPRNLALGWLFGLGAAAGLVFVREGFNSTLRRPGDAERQLDVRELGVIPAFVLKRRPARLIDDGWKDADGAPELVCAHGEGSALAEAFQTTLTSLESLELHGAAPRRIVVSSARSGEGKTTILANLGVAAAQRGQRVLLIDGDLRGARLHELFELDNRFGLSNLLRSSRRQGEMLDTLVRSTKQPNLFVLPAGSITTTIPKLLSSKRWAELLEALERQFDLILIDSPPGLAVADARQLARAASGVLFVVRAGSTDTDSADALNRRFAVDGATVLGAVLNGFKASPDGSPWMDPRDRRYYDRVGRIHSAGRG